MKSTLKIAALGLLVLAVLPVSAEAKSKPKPWKQQTYCDPVDVACQMSNGQFKSASSRRAVVRRGPDCGQSDADTARGLSALSNIAGLAPVPGIGIIFGIAAGEASAQAEKKQWNCFERNVKSQLAASVRGIERQAIAYVGQIERQYAAEVTEMREVVVQMRQRIFALENQQALADLRPSESMRQEMGGFCARRNGVISLCAGFDAAPQLLSAPQPAKRPSPIAPSSAPGAPALDPAQQHEASVPFTSYAGRLGQYLHQLAQR